jgi:hypothetical protein
MLKVWKISLNFSWIHPLLKLKILWMSKLHLCFSVYIFNSSVCFLILCFGVLFYIFSIGLITDYYQFVDKEYYSSSKLCKEIEFNGLYPHKTLFEFVRTLEEGMFVLCCKVVGVFPIKQWFYPVRRCGEFLEFAAGSYYCVMCHVTVFSIPSRYCLCLW